MSLNLRNGVRFILVEICALTAMAIYFEVITTGRAGGLKRPPGWGQNVLVFVKRARERERKELCQIMKN